MLKVRRGELVGSCHMHARHRSADCGFIYFLSRWRYQIWVGFLQSATDQLLVGKSQNGWLTCVNRQGTDAQDSTRTEKGRGGAVYQARAGLPQVTAHKTTFVAALLFDKEICNFPFFFLFFSAEKKDVRICFNEDQSRY